MGSLTGEECLNRLPVAIVKENMTNETDARVTLIYEQRKLPKIKSQGQVSVVLFKVGLLYGLLHDKNSKNRQAFLTYSLYGTSWRLLKFK